jgi:hypothetical protein
MEAHKVKVSNSPKVTSGVQVRLAMDWSLKVMKGWTVVEKI